MIVATLSILAWSAACGGTPYRALDYWSGDWTVTVNGKTAGTSHVESAADGCALLETWNGRTGETGHSISAYDSSSGRWLQRYVSGRAIVTDYRGTIAPDGSVLFIAGAGSALQRMTFTRLADGRVRQRFETSTDGGTTWNGARDFIYARKR